jgi:hypothetical protein
MHSSVRLLETASAQVIGLLLLLVPPLMTVLVSVAVHCHRRRVGRVVAIKLVLVLVNALLLV